MNRLDSWIACWVDLACALTAICTLARVHPNWDIRYRHYAIMKRFDQQKRVRANHQQATRIQ